MFKLFRRAAAKPTDADVMARAIERMLDPSKRATNPRLNIYESAAGAPSRPEGAVRGCAYGSFPLAAVDLGLPVERGERVAKKVAQALRPGAPSTINVLTETLVGRGGWGDAPNWARAVEVTEAARERELAGVS